jgi:hypothetical protein
MGWWLSEYGPLVVGLVFVVVLSIVKDCDELCPVKPPAAQEAQTCKDTCRQVQAEVWLWSERYGCLCLDAIDYPADVGKAGL